MTVPETSELLTHTEAARELGVANHDLSELIASGEVEVVAIDVPGRQGRCVRVSRDELDRYRAAHHHP